jgi:NAD(P)H dehydrogenase (quinone)
MRVLVVYCHPNPKSFNHAVKDEVAVGLAEAGHEVKLRDLYAEPFKTTLDAADFGQIMGGSTPVDIKREQELIAWAEGLVFIYPVWWFGLPAALKGWIDRVFLVGFAFSYEATGPKGLLKHRKALVLNTTGGPEGIYKATDSKEIYIRPMTDGVLRFCGIKDVHAKTFWAVPYVDDAARKAMLVEARALAKQF